MKKTFANIRTLAAVLMASAALVACNKEYNATAEQTPQVYTLAIQAGMDSNAQTKALELNGTKLVAKWAAGDELTVINVTSGTPLGGTLTASNVSADGQTCTFSGTLTGAIAVDNQLALHYHAISGTQDGTLVSAAANDHAFANVTVASVEAGNITISGGTATFNTMTAMLKLTLKDGSANALNATSLKMTVDGVDIFTASPTAATYTANGNGVLYFAVPRQIEAAEKIVVEKSGGHPTEELLNTWMTYLNTYTVTFSATVGSDTYTATKTGYKLAAGKYYATELTMAKEAPATDLSTISADYEAKDGEVLTGTLVNNVKISIADGATETLKNVNITNLGDNCNWAGINCPGDATLVLEGTNEVCAGRDGSGETYYPGIYIAPYMTLTIQGAGNLTAYSNGTNPFGAGIGGGFEIPCGNIVINSGNITATGGDYGAGIGGCGFSASCGNITINGGTITATGGESAAGIGGGGYASCGNITISGGDITATGGEGAAGIGGGYTNGDYGTITIKSTVTSVTATKGSDAPNSIGAGLDGKAITVTIEDGANVTQN